MRRITAILVIGAALALCAGAPALATNGMYMVGYGAETIGRGGANIAISDRSLALSFNPAGIAQLQGNHATLNISVLNPSLEYENMLNGPVKSESASFPMPAFSYVRGSKESPWSWGVGLIGIGGMGAHFKGLNTPFGTVDETFTEVSFGAITPTVAYAVNDDMAFGLTLDIGYGQASYKFYPDTSFFNTMAPEYSFFGMDMDNAAGMQYAARLGWWWRPDPKFSIGVIYQTETESTFEDGTMTMNFEAHPFLQQRVKYDAEMDGFTFSAQAGIGFAYRPTDKLELAFDVKRYYWDHAINTITVYATNPEIQGAPDITVPFIFNWEDQWVFAVGADYRVNDKVTLRAGYNYGENPVPDETLNPLFPATVENHASLGASIYSKSITWEFGLERGFEAENTNNNPNPQVNPFGPGSTVRHDQWTVAFGLSWAWARN